MRIQEIRHKPILFDEKNDLFPKQYEFITDTSRFLTALCSRRAGKSNAIGRKLRKMATSGQEFNCLYIARTTDACKRIMWQMLISIVEKYHRKNEYKLNVTDLSIYFKETNSFIWLKGANDTSQIEKLRGIKLKFACIDEAAFFPAYVEYLVEEIVIPSLEDLQGQLALCSSPNKMCTGYFHDVIEKGNWSHHHWNIFDNVFLIESAKKENSKITCAQDIIDAACLRKGVTLDNPSIQRDYYGIAVKSSELQVYKYTKELQNFDIAPAKLIHILGIDLGFNDSDAIVCFGFHESTGIGYVVEQFKKSKMDITDLANKIHYFDKKYKPITSVIDAGALGKKINQELNTRHNLSLIPAEKERKPEFIELFNDSLRTGKIKIKHGTELQKEMSLLTWDEDAYERNIFKESDSCENHLTDATLYAWRWAWTNKVNKKAKLTPEQLEMKNYEKRFKKQEF